MKQQMDLVQICFCLFHLAHVLVIAIPSFAYRIVLIMRCAFTRPLQEAQEVVLSQTFDRVVKSSKDTPFCVVRNVAK